jgi:two-component system NtrC family sensor kinase/two-component system sensor histidine kinase AtoS
MSGITAEELNLLIEQTYKVEREFTDLKESYAHLQNTIEQVVEFLPNAVWILDEEGSVFLQNSQANSLSELLELLKSKNDDYEVNFNKRSYLIKSSSYQDKYDLV